MPSMMTVYSKLDMATTIGRLAAASVSKEFNEKARKEEEKEGRRRRDKDNKE